MNKDSCPFLTGNERMNLIISEGHLQKMLFEQFVDDSDQPYLHIYKENEPEKDHRRESVQNKNEIQQSISAAAELASHFTDDLQCIVCQQIPIDLKECKSCNKILCKYCQEGIKMQADVAKGQNAVCPNCKSTNFEFQEIENKLVRSLLANLKVQHKCTHA